MSTTLYFLGVPLSTGPCVFCGLCRIVWAVAHIELENPELWVPPSTFGSRLAQIRQAKGWNVKQAADACGLPDQSWHNWEDGRSPRDLTAVAQKIAKAVPCHYVWLMTGIETTKTRSEKRERASDLGFSVIDGPKKLLRSASNRTPMLVATT